MTPDELTSADPLSAARTILGARLRVDDVVARIVEVEAYGGPADGPWPDPAAHSYRGPTTRNAVMFGPAGRLYVYRSYGMHCCVNVSYGPVGVAGGVLLRGAEIVAGEETVRARRPRARRAADFARGPGNLASALGIVMADNGSALFDKGSRIRLELADPVRWTGGPRVGVSVAAERPWRLWIPGSPAVSAYRRSPRAAPVER